MTKYFPRSTDLCSKHADLVYL